MKCARLPSVHPPHQAVAVMLRQRVADDDRGHAVGMARSTHGAPPGRKYDCVSGKDFRGRLRGIDEIDHHTGTFFSAGYTRGFGVGDEHAGGRTTECEHGEQSEGGDDFVVHLAYVALGARLVHST